MVHATEDPRTLAEAVLTLLGVAAQPEEDRMEGHFGNPITWVRYHLIGDDAAAALASIAARLKAPTKESLQRGLGERVDEHSALYLRFDKQRLVAGVLEEGTGDPVRVKVKPRGFLPRGGAEQFYARMLFGGI
jgi:RNA binding exosome subunit